VVVGNSGVCDGRVRVPHHALVSTLAVMRPVVAGQPFQPDARRKQLLIEAADVAWAMNQAVSMAPPGSICWPGVSSWRPDQAPAIYNSDAATALARPLRPASPRLAKSRMALR
jgi:hypothetical protein